MATARKLHELLPGVSLIEAPGHTPGTMSMQVDLPVNDLGAWYSSVEQGAVGYDESDVEALVEGTMKQQRLLATSPKPVTGEDAAAIFRRSMDLW